MINRLLFVGLVTIFSHAAFADGVFMVVKGDVKVVAKGKAPVAAKVGMKINDPDKVIAGKDSRAKIVMQDKNVLNISPNSEVVIETYKTAEADGKKEVSLNVLYGKVRATVNQKYDGDKNKFQVKTPSAVAGVRGTDFVTEHNAQTNQSKIVTFEGTVQVSDESGRNPVTVDAGEQSVTKNDGPPGESTKVPAQELQAMNKETNTDGGSRPESNSSPERGTANDNEKENNSDGDKKEKENNRDGEKNDKGADKNDENKGEKNADGKGPGAPGPKGPPIAGGPDGGSSDDGNSSGESPSDVSGEPKGDQSNDRGPAADGSNPPPDGPLAGPDTQGDGPTTGGGEPPPPCLTCDIIAAPEPPPIPQLPELPPILGDIYQPPEIPPDIINSTTNLTVIINVQ